jgi:hypothetical protein
MEQSAVKQLQLLAMREFIMTLPLAQQIKVLAVVNKPLYNLSVLNIKEVKK